MKDVHPKTRRFSRFSTNKQFLIESTILTKDKAVYKEDGKEYPLVRIEVSSDSHPFYTGQQTFIQAKDAWIDSTNVIAEVNIQLKSLKG